MDENRQQKWLTHPLCIKEKIMAKLDVDACAAVIDEHTGSVKAQFEGFGAEKDARSFLRTCQQPGTGRTKVDFLSSATIITGKEAKKAIARGRT